MNHELIRAKLDSLEMTLHSLHEMKRKLDQEAVAKYQGMHAQLLAELQRVESVLAASGVSTTKS